MGLVRAFVVVAVILMGIAGRPSSAFADRAVIGTIVDEVTGDSGIE
jgi:hypothetical protein